tara:strand:- start:181 stop:552 length:372 start_codon:yes stop_codon:yes gene_type:complete
MAKRYYNINEVSKLLGIREHVIRYWDSIDPKTNKLRFEGISTKTKGGTRYFSNENIIKLKKLKNLLYDNGSQNYSLKLANKLLTINKTNQNYSKNTNYNRNHNTTEKTKKIKEILSNLRSLSL